MTDQQLHEIAMLALSKTEFATKNNAVGLATEMLQQYHSIIVKLTETSAALDNVCVIDDFGTPSAGCAKK